MEVVDIKVAKSANYCYMKIIDYCWKFGKQYWFSNL